MEGNIADTDYKELTREAYTKGAKKFAATRSGKAPWGEFSLFLAYLEHKHPLHVIDAGCGSGRLLSFLEKEVQIASYTGIDFSEELVKEAKSWNKDILKKSENYIFHCADFLDYPLLKNNYDAIFFVASLCHIPTEAERNDAVQKAYHALKRGGKIILLNWNLQQAKEKQITFLNKEKTNALVSFTTEEGKKYNRFYHQFSEREMKELLESVGFKVVEQFYTAKGEKVGNKKDGWNLCSIGEKV